MKRIDSRLVTGLATGLLVTALAGCGKTPPASPAPQGQNGAQPTAPVGPTPESAQADAARAAEIAAKEKELADREAALKQQQVELELARRNAETAARQANAAAAAAKRAAAPAKPAPVAAAAPPKPAAPPPPPPPIVVPAGTQLAIELTTPVSTKTATSGSAVQGRLASDLVVGGRRAAAAGTAVSGKITQVVSGSKKIGGTPTLGITFDTMTAANGAPVAISARFLQQAASDTGKDTAKIVGTTAAGAIIGHQISHKNGAIIGGIIGAGAGTAIAQNTGGEVSLAAGTVLSVALDDALQLPGN